MTREEFIKQRCKIDKITEGEFAKKYRVVDCNCGKIYCKGYRCLDLDGLLKENERLKTQLSGTTFCYDEEEHRKLKNQLENCYCNRTDCSGRIKDSKVYDSLVQKVANQQKEFINYLQKEIKFYNDRVEAIDSVCSSIYSEDYDNSKMKLAIYKEILQKYKEIIQTKNNNSV